MSLVVRLSALGFFAKFVVTRADTAATCAGGGCDSDADDAQLIETSLLQLKQKKWYSPTPSPQPPMDLKCGTDGFNYAFSGWWSSVAWTEKRLKWRTAKRCANVCKNDSNCVAFSFGKGKCYTYTSVADANKHYANDYSACRKKWRPPTPSPTSPMDRKCGKDGFKFAFSGWWSNHGSAHAGISTPGGCAQLCESTPNCVAFSLYSETNCHIYTEKGIRQYNDLSVACTKGDDAQLIETSLLQLKQKKWGNCGDGFSETFSGWWTNVAWTEQCCGWYSAERCANACKNDYNCVAFSFGNGKCYTYTSVADASKHYANDYAACQKNWGSPTPSPQPPMDRNCGKDGFNFAFSGWWSNHGSARWGINSNTPGGCATLCEWTPNCVAFSLYNDENCYLYTDKKSKGERHYSDMSVACTKGKWAW